MNVFDELQARGLIAQMTNEEKIRELLGGDKPVVFYIGFDPTADSLHVGHFLQIVVMAHMQRAGHIPIALFGGGTAMVGDPSGRTDMRKMLSQEELQYNISCFKRQMSPLLDFSEGKARMVDNGDWLLGLNYVDFLRDIGVHFSVNRMLSFECYKSRLEKGLSFIEFNYMLMQSYDFLRLFETQGCVMQLGGDDQWSNIIGGVELVRRIKGEEVCGMTFNLLTTSDGTKMGKTAKGAVWLDPEKFAPYDFYQYWRNIADGDVLKCLRQLTFLPLDEIARYENASGGELNPLKELLAYEITKMVHGEAQAERAQAAARAIFSGGADDADMPETDVLSSGLGDGIAIVDLLTRCSLAPSKSEARRLVLQGGIELGGERVSDPAYRVTTADFADGRLVIKKGKKIYHRVLLG